MGRHKDEDEFPLLSGVCAPLPFYPYLYFVILAFALVIFALALALARQEDVVLPTLIFECHGRECHGPHAYEFSI